MSTAIHHRHARHTRRHEQSGAAKTAYTFSLVAACILGGVLLSQMVGQARSAGSAAVFVLAAGFVVGLFWLLVCAPLSSARPAGLWSLYALTPAEFESYVADLFSAAGYSTRAVGGSGDGGVDVRVWRAGWTGIVQCKRYRPDRVIGPAAVRELVGTRAHERAQRAWLVTTASLSASALRLADEEGVVVLDARALAARHPIAPARGPRLPRAWY